MPLLDAASIGIALAFLSMLCFGFGDYCIQRTVRCIGSCKALFFIGMTGGIVLFPIVAQDITTLTKVDILLLILLTVVTIFAAFFDFEALRSGKIAIVEPVIGMELPITVGLSMTLAGESLKIEQLMLIGAVFIGIVLAVTIHHTHLHYHRRIFERGVILAGLGAIAMALTNFLTGISSQEISPLMTIWFSFALTGTICGIYLFSRGELHTLWKDMEKHRTLILCQSALDTAAWMAYASAMALIPIAIATTISETYIALAVLLGIKVSKERLKFHQKIGIGLSIAGIVILSALSS